MILTKAVSYSVDEEHDQSAQHWCKMTSKFTTTIGVDKTWMAGEQHIGHEWTWMFNFPVLDADCVDGECPNKRNYSLSLCSEWFLLHKTNDITFLID